MQKEDSLMEKVIITLIIIITLGITFNQFRLSGYSGNMLANAFSFFLIFILIAVTAWAIISKDSRSDSFSYSSGGISEHHTAKSKPWSFMEKVSYSVVGIVAFMVLFNQVQIAEVDALVNGGSSGLSSFTKSAFTPVMLASGKSGIVVGPQLNTDGRTTRLVEWPTISVTKKPADTGNPTQDAISTVIPIGTPFYALEGPGVERISGATFDDPLTSQKVWASLLGSKRFGTENAIQLTAEEEQRWQQLTGVFTCDFCCGGPSSVTTISRCGCAHSYAWQGMAKFFIKYYPEYSNEEILGEMTKWKGLWYPQGMIQDYLVFTGQQSADILNHGGSIGIREQFSQQGGNQHQTSAAAVPLSDLPSMVGGC